MMLRISLSFFMLLALVSCSLSSNSSSALIDSCYDGDTCRTSSGERIRLACIDAPELRGKMADPVRGKAARDYLRSLVTKRIVGIRRINTDRYGRTVAELFVDEDNVQQLLVAAGHAEIYKKYANQCSWAL